MPGIDLEDIMAGISICRNQNLADVFYRLHLIEAYGTGMGKIMKAYEGTAEKPVIETTRNTFKIILPNRNAKSEAKDTPGFKVESPAYFNNAVKETMDEREVQILKYARNHAFFTKNDVAALLQVSPSTASRLIRGLVKRNLLKSSGKAKSTHYAISAENQAAQRDI